MSRMSKDGRQRMSQPEVGGHYRSLEDTFGHVGDDVRRL